MKQKQFSNICVTKDYARFKLLPGNRKINLKNYNRLKKSMHGKQLVTPIIINKKNQVIDGQHRLKVCQELGLPVYFYVCPNYSLEEVHTLNTMQKDWGLQDYLDGYASLGYKEYLDFKRLKEVYADFTIAKLMVIASSITTYLNDGERYNISAAFKNGVYQCNIKRAKYRLDSLRKVGKYYDLYNSRTFTRALIPYLNNDKFDLDSFLAKLKFRARLLYNAVDTSDMTEIIEDIYNYKRRAKVSFKYAV